MFAPSLRLLWQTTASGGRLLRRLALLLGLIWAAGLYSYYPTGLLLLPACGSLIGLLAALAGTTIIRRVNAEGLLWCCVLISIIFFRLIPGPQPENWQAPWQHAPIFDIRGDSLTIRNLRDFRYRSETDFDPVWRSETYDLSAIKGADFAECHWDGMELICHTMISFSFADGKHLVVSAETRLPEGEKQSAIGGLYKRYGLIYLFGTEEDIFGLRTNHRHEDLLLLPMRISPDQARDMLLHFIQLAQEAEQRHTAYNTLSNNCSSGVMSTFRHLAPNMPFYYDLAPIHNGDISGILFRHGALHTRPGESYDELRKRCYLRYDISPDNPQLYSEALRNIINQ